MNATGIARYVNRSLRCYYRSDEGEDFSEPLRQGARECHEELRRVGPMMLRRREKKVKEDSPLSRSLSDVRQ